MKRFACVAGFLAVLFVAQVAFLPHGALSQNQLWTVDRVESFVKRSLPNVEGTVVSVEEEGIYVNLEQSGSISSAPVQVFRKEVSLSGGERSIQERILGSGTLKKQKDNLAVLVVSDRVRSRLKNGDQVRSSGFKLFLSDKTGVASAAWIQRLSSIEGIKQVKKGTPSGGDSGLNLVLQISSDEISLKKAGEWGALAKLKRSDVNARSRETQEGRDPSKPYIERLTLVERILNDFSLITLPDYPNVEIVQLAAKNSIGFGRWKQDQIKSLSWHSVNGEVLSISPLADRMDGLDSFPFLLVKKRNGTISSYYYEYDLTQRSMIQRWSARNTWIESVGDRIYAWQIGLNEPFKKKGYPVTVKDSTWDWKDYEKLLIPSLSVPSAVSISNQTIFRLNKDGKLDVFRNGQKSHSTSQVFGAHPVSLSARRSKIESARHPSFLTWEDEAGQTRLLIGNNQTKGVPYFKGLQSYDESRLYLLLNKQDFVDTLWESDRLSGYVAGVFPGKDGPYVASVKPSDGATIIRRIKNTGYRDQPAR